MMPINPSYAAKCWWWHQKKPLNNRFTGPVDTLRPPISANLLILNSCCQRVWSRDTHTHAISPRCVCSVFRRNTCNHTAALKLYFIKNNLTYEKKWERARKLHKDKNIPTPHHAHHINDCVVWSSQHSQLHPITPSLSVVTLQNKSINQHTVSVFYHRELNSLTEMANYCTYDLFRIIDRTEGKIIVQIQ